MNWSPVWQSLADSASALRCEAAIERREWLEQAAGLDLFAGLGGVEADRLRRGGMQIRLGARCRRPS